jgi:hypothetical protein
MLSREEVNNDESKAIYGTLMNRDMHHQTTKPEVNSYPTPFRPHSASPKQLFKIIIFRMKVHETGIQ